MDRYLLVLIGGGLGALARYIAATFITQRYGGLFPWGTFAINVTGSFAIGLLMTIFTERVMHPYWRLLLVVGFLGGYTTFSAFEWETIALGRTSPVLAILYCGSSVLLGLLACWLGVTLGRRI